MYIGYTNGQHFDCEQPPEVENASSRLSVDDAEDSVSARYTCDPGFELQGEPDLFCDLDTDEWQGQPPICKPGEFITLQMPIMQLQQDITRVVNID